MLGISLIKTGHKAVLTPLNVNYKLIFKYCRREENREECRQNLREAKARKGL
jgi:hypothetical protein